jgi:putative transposase
MANRRPPRLQSFDYLGTYRYFVTCCVADRRKAFCEDSVVNALRALILRTCRERQFEEIASVFMPDHLHSLVTGLSVDSAFVPFMSVLRQRTAVEYRRVKGLALWQDGYFDRVLRRDEETHDVLAYMLDNPVRAGLVKNRPDYPYSWCKYGFDL